MLSRVLIFCVIAVAFTCTTILPCSYAQSPSVAPDTHTKIMQFRPGDRSKSGVTPEFDVPVCSSTGVGAFAPTWVGDFLGLGNGRDILLAHPGTVQSCLDADLCKRYPKHPSRGWIWIRGHEGVSFGANLPLPFDDSER